MKNSLIIGYGNYDRQDDGVAWHILLSLAKICDKTLPSSPDEGFEPEGNYPHLYFLPQLTPEIAELISAYEQVCFVDAHTGSVPEDIHVEELHPLYTSSPFTHHLTPATCLELVRILAQKQPQSLLVSVRGHQFGFSQVLSPETETLIPEAVKHIQRWINCP
jgi:hydrogenase maturation protease